LNFARLVEGAKVIRAWSFMHALSPNAELMMLDENRHAASIGRDSRKLGIGNYAWLDSGHRCVALVLNA
jgi:hypothetical protein